MSTIHISEAEAASNFSGLMAWVRAGAEVIIEGGSSRVRLSALPVRAGRLLSDSIRLAEAYSVSGGSEPALELDFAEDVREIVSRREPRDVSAWD
jgi:hypothetical protein